MRVVAKFGEGLKRKNSTKEGYECHHKNGDGLLLQQALIARVHVDAAAHCCQMQIYLDSSCSFVSQCGQNFTYLCCYAQWSWRTEVTTKLFYIFDDPDHFVPVVKCIYSHRSLAVMSGEGR